MQKHHFFGKIHIAKICRRSAFLAAALLLFTQSIAVSAQTFLPSGSVKGLPEQIMAIDENGNSVNSETGEYFYQVDNLEPGMEYIKNIEIANYRGDAAYHIYFLSEIISKEGEIDLEKEIDLTYYLDGEPIYHKPSGQLMEPPEIEKDEQKPDGQKQDSPSRGETAAAVFKKFPVMAATLAMPQVAMATPPGPLDPPPDLSKKPLDLGCYYAFGYGKKMFTCSIIWPGSSAGGHIDNGERVVDATGEHVVRDKTGKETIHGELLFRWVFYANIEQDPDDTTPGKSNVKTGIEATGMKIYIVILSGISVGIVLLLILINKKSRKDNKKGKEGGPHEKGS